MYGPNQIVIDGEDKTQTGDFYNCVIVKPDFVPSCDWTTIHKYWSFALR